MLFTVVAVGDGACSIVRHWPAGRVMLVDCGTTGNAGISPSETLAVELGQHARRIDTVVITHFDTDHWRGLRDLPDHWTDLPEGVVEFRYPALLPGDAGLVQRAYLAVQATRASGPIFGALDVVGAWERAGATVRRRPSMRGDRFCGGGSRWTVHWPPTDDRFFDKKTRDDMRALESEVRELAEKVSEFQSALDAVQAAWFADGRDQSFDDHPLHSVTGDQLSGALREELGNDGFTSLAQKLSQFTNELSLVHSNRSVANFGDCEKAGLEALVSTERSDPTLAWSYPVILAPHHGTVTPKQVVHDHFPRATHALVSQNGRKRYDAGRRAEQARFKSSVTGGMGLQLDTHDPAGIPSLAGPHVRFWLSP